MNSKKEKVVIYAFLAISVVSFFFFGLYHLTKTETTDEHLWKYGRIKQYWQAIAKKDWERTYINDKPGITVALISGIGLIFEPEPEKHRIKNETFTLFDTNKTERINFVFRFPILVFATLSLFLFFWLMKKAFDSEWLALLAVMFLALNPILIGITQVINPDSFLWIFSGLSILSYLAYLNKKEKHFLLATGIFTGFAMLSKYTAIILFVFYFLLFLAKLIFQREDEKNNIDYKFILREILNFILIFLVSVAIFIFFIPAIFVESSYLTKGVAQFFTRGNPTILIVFAILLPVFIVFFGKKIFSSSTGFISQNKDRILAAFAALFLLIVFVIIVNVLCDQKLIPFDQLRDTAYAQEPRKFNFGKMLKNDQFLEKNAKLYLLEAYPFIFSLTPLSLLLVVFLSTKAIFKKLQEQSKIILFSVLIFFMMYLIVTIAVKVVANVRYSIILQFPFGLLSAVALWELLRSLKIQNKKYLINSASVVFLAGFYSLWLIRPFYFSYENFLLPKKFTINSSWGHGFYEAAEYLNSKPNPENLVIYSNSATICPFFKGRCLDSRRIDLNFVKPDYFVISRRGELKTKNRFIFTNPDFKGKPGDYYFENIKNNYEWAIFIGGRENNYVKVVKFEN